MKVSDLINRLSELNPDAEVVIPGYEGGWTSANHISRGILTRNVYSAWYCGPHEFAESDSESYDSMNYHFPKEVASAFSDTSSEVASSSF